MVLSNCILVRPHYQKGCGMADHTHHVTFQTLEKDILANKIVDSLLNLISEKQLLPGDKLPPERELARMMNVGRPALREALRALSVMKVIEIRPGSGAYVSALEPEQLVQPLEFVFSLDNSSIIHLVNARRILELNTVVEAAKQITPEEITKLESLLVQMADNIDNPEKCDELDREFHKTIASAARNPILYQFVSVVNQLGSKSRQKSYGLPGVLPPTLDEHRAIVDALKAHAPERAQEAMRYHLDQAELHLRQLIDTQTPATNTN
ncbi:MAG: FadR family transcriptional regulator [Chloroflexi bacterium]|nr:MAG: FadR family transcriptional regulator [Chloroflexota bacterium]